MVTMEDMLIIGAQRTSYFNSLIAGENSLNQVIDSGKSIYESPLYTDAFPQDIAAFRQYLINVQSTINNFISTFPVAPPLQR